jgi:hypothetical protein
MIDDNKNFIESDEQKFYRLVRRSTPYGKYHAANITWKGYDYFAESHLDDGEQLAVDRLFENLKGLGLIKTFI